MGFSETFDQYMDPVEAILERLHRHNINWKASKRQFFKREVTSHMATWSLKQKFKTDLEKLNEYDRLGYLFSMTA